LNPRDGAHFAQAIKQIYAFISPEKLAVLSPALLSSKGFNPGRETAARAVAISSMLKISVVDGLVLLGLSLLHEKIYLQTRLGCPVSMFKTMKRMRQVNAGMIPSEKVK